MPAAIETQVLTRRFGDRVAVDGISMSVPERSIYGFLGRNGAGKTTTIKLLLGLLKADAGSAWIAGIDVATDRLGAAPGGGRRRVCRYSRRAAKTLVSPCLGYGDGTLRQGDS